MDMASLACDASLAELYNPAYPNSLNSAKPLPVSIMHQPSTLFNQIVHIPFITSVSCVIVMSKAYRTTKEDQAFY